MKTLKLGNQRFQVRAEVPREQGRIVLAHGEVTGHAHAIVSKHATLYETTDDAEAARLGTRILATTATTRLAHEEHDPIEIPKGEWGVRIQRQYDAGTARRVED